MQNTKHKTQKMNLFPSPRYSDCQFVEHDDDAYIDSNNDNNKNNKLMLYREPRRRQWRRSVAMPILLSVWPIVQDLEPHMEFSLQCHFGKSLWKAKTNKHCNYTNIKNLFIHFKYTIYIHEPSC